MTRIALLLALIATAAGAEKPADFAFGVPLALEGDHAFYRVELPSAVYSGSARTDVGDLRVFNADDAMVPYAYVPRSVPVREKRAPVAVPLFPLLADRDGGELSGLALTFTRNASGTVVNLATKDGQSVPAQRLVGYFVDATALTEPFTALTFAWPAPAQGVTTRIRIEASDDLAGWRTLTAAAPLLDLEYGGRRLKRDRVELPAGQPKYLRLTWPAGAPVLELSGVQAEFGELVRESPRQWSETTGVPVAEHENEFEFDLGGAFPVDRIAIDLPEINAVVPGVLAARATSGEPWRPVASLVAYRLRQDGGEVTATPTPVAAPGMRYWLLRVDPKSGGFGRGQPRLRAGWLPEEIVFAARGAGPFVIAYGNPGATSTALPIATLVPGYLTAKDPLAAAGGARPEPSAPLGGAARLRPAHDLRRATLWGVLILGVVVLAWMAWRLSKQVQSAPGAQRGTRPEPPDSNAS